MTKINIKSGTFHSNLRENKTDKIIKKQKNNIEFVYFPDDKLEIFEANLSEISGKSSSFLYFKRKLSSYMLSAITVIIIMFALLSSSMYEDVIKKIILETPFVWERADTISLIFVIIFFMGLILMPSILDGEHSQLKELLKSWFNKHSRIIKRINFLLHPIDKKYSIHCYNIDLEDKEHWIWKVAITCLISHFKEITFHVRNDQKNMLENRLKDFGINNINIYPLNEGKDIVKQIDFMLSQKEKSLFSLLQLSSTNFIQKEDKNTYVSLELFEYCGRSFIIDKNDKNQLISGFQNFIHRSFDDFNFLVQYKSQQICLIHHSKSNEIEDERRRLSYYLRNHIEECLELFDNPISLLILYHYVKDIVLDEKRVLIILEKFIFCIKKKQQYELISQYWFNIAGNMFDSKNIEDFEQNSNSIYRKLSIKSLDTLMFLFERNGYFEQALFLAQYLYEINPNKYAIDICSLFERRGEFDKAYESLPNEFMKYETQEKPTDIEIRYFQRKAWIIVSQRKDKQKEEGLECIEQLNSLIFSHMSNNEPLWLWHFYNIKANYAEWDEKYDEAIAFYKKCLAIPGLGAFEYGATFVNMGIAYRFKFIEKEFMDQSSIDKAIELGKTGIVLKESVGERDEMPVVLHNQALNMLYKVAYCNFDEKSLQNIKEVTQDAISILDRTFSIKRLGILLCENIIVKEILEEDNSDLIKRLESHWKDMPDYEKEQTKKIYDIFKQHRKCQKLKINLD